MGQLSPLVRSQAAGRVAFWCPGCDEVHSIPVEGPQAWDYNGDPAAPTFKPSIHVKSGHYARGGPPGECWCDYEARFGEASRFKCTSCHSYVTGGRIQFLSDCTHALAGQTVDLPIFERGES